MATKIHSLIWRCLYHLRVILGSERTAEVSCLYRPPGVDKLTSEANLWMM